VADGLHERACGAMMSQLHFGPGIDVMRGYHCQRAADAALMVVKVHVENLERESEDATWDEAIVAVLELLTP
jgi:hypothetical protein